MARHSMAGRLRISALAGLLPRAFRTRRRRRTALAVAVAVLGAGVGYGQLTGAWTARADEHMAGHDTLRTSWDSKEPNLSASTVTGSNFGQLFATTVKGQVYAQPLVIGNTVVVNTEDDWVYGLDAATGAVKWAKDFGPPWPASTIGCADLAPNLGSTSTAVYDPASNTVYLTTKVNDGVDAHHPNWYLHAVDATTGAERTGWPVRIVGTPINDASHPFVAESVNQRPGLLLMDGAVYLAFGSQCDYLPNQYVGYVVGVNIGTHAINIWSDEAGASSSRAGIWHGGGGLVSDGPGRIFVATGNGVTPPNGPGTNPPQQLSESVVRLGVASNGTISANDFFSPANAAILDQNDQDLGSGGPVALPAPYFGTAAIPNLLAEIGKDGRLFLLNRDNLGGKAQGSGGTDAVVQTLGPYKGVWGHPAGYGGEGGYLYFVQNKGSMLAFKYGVDGAGKPALSLAGNTRETFGYTAGSPLVTSNGTTPGTAVVWVVNVDGPTGSNGQLCAYNAIPANNVLTLLRCFPIGAAVKFSTPASSNGRVYVGTRDGQVFGFGQPTAAPLTAPQLSFGSIPVGSTGTGTVVATASRPATVTGISAAAPFGTTPPALPVTLNAGQTISVPVSFTPATPGSVTGGLTFTVTEGGGTATIGTSLQGSATRPGFWPTPSTLEFGDVPVGSNKSLTVSFTNTGTANETVTATHPPGGQFAVTGLPATGTMLTPGQSVSASVTFTPTAAGAASATVSVTGASGTASVPLTGNAVTGHAQLTISPASINFGQLPVGRSATQTLTVENTGNLNVTITKAAPPTLPFVVATPLPEGQVLAPEEAIQIPITFTPSVAGSFTGVYTISSDDGAGAHTVPISGSAVNPPGGTPLPSVMSGGWVYNGTATMSGPNLVLTTATAQQAGSAVFSTPIPSDGLRASFTAQIGGGTGADGMTFAMLNASSASPNSLGGGGAGLGFYNLPGIAVTLDTYQGGNDPSNNFIGLSTGGAGGFLTYVATATNIPSLRTGTHTVLVAATGGTVTVSVDGTQVLSANVNLPPSILAAFTGSTGGRTDQHMVSNVSITSGSTSLPQPGTGWRFNGTAAMGPSSVVLTPAIGFAAGSVFYTDPVPTNGLTASFSLSMNGGTGADGATFALLDPAGAGPTSLGQNGGGLGFARLAGVAVAFGTHSQPGINSNNWMAIEAGTAGGAPTLVATVTSGLPPLRTGSHTVSVSIANTTISVSIDGRHIVSTAVGGLTANAIVGFTGATGGSTDVHAVANAQIITGSATVPPAPAGWTLNGSATANGGTITLTPATADQTGTAIDATPIATANLDAKFTIQIGGVTGADGMTFMLLNPATSSGTSIGVGGGGLGFSGLSGVAVAFVTYKQTSYPSNNFVGISTGGSGRTLSFVATTTAVPPLRTGTHAVEVKTGATGHLVVLVDNVQVLDTAVAIPANALVGFSGATGGGTDLHAVSGVTIVH